MKTKPSQSAGFSLVETFVAITILLIVIVGPMTISSSTARSTSFSSEQVVAFFLAQEGLELAQKARDDFALDTTRKWDDFVDDTATGPVANQGAYGHCFSSDGCPLILDETTGSVLVSDTDNARRNCNNDGSRCRLHYSLDADGRSSYVHAEAGNTQTPYTRVIRFEQTAPNEVRVESWVYWRSGTRRVGQEVKAETYLYNVFNN
jgi:Tfp pilus assembly protein PilV